ncbi:MAG TPA: EF-hand domain-containing protein [Lachnospiraceae bacterium]|nr:EF-hand domain-containing protein [Lachnospiraceae bacterium]
MINPVNSTSNYLSVHSNSREVQKIRQLEAIKKESANQTDTYKESKDASNYSLTDTDMLTMEDYMGMMQASKKQVDFTFMKDQSESEEDYGDIDADGDGTISTDEYDALMSQMGITDAPSSEEFFTKYDTDGDGEITSEEMDSIKPRKPMGPPPSEEESVAEGIDADGDGTISADEYDTLVSQMGVTDALSAEEFFTKYDTNEDGEISADEAEAIQSTNEESQSQKFRSLAASVLRAYETNYEYMFDADNSSSDSIA